ncbi:MAG TPA: 1-acyl-sn-glycerol-3-phosphate acyltransferase [Micromonosporaceae bacterium]|nr:1-acyl-sn-glycerol-3-phosphate acyltransferase [Micromonosporaceae bacterium]
MTSLWRPPCPCDVRCLHAAPAQVGAFTALGRALSAAGVLLLGTLRPAGSGRLARSLLRAMGIRWSVVGAPLRPGSLLAGNHVSWLDIVVMMAIDDRIRLVSKVEVGDWPVIGRMARASGTIFVDRSRPRSLPGTVAEVTAALRKGDLVQVFPEGTTTCGAHPARWRPAFLQAAVDAQAPVQRFTLLFSTAAAAFVEGENLLQSLRRVLRVRGLSVTVLVDEPQRADAGRRQLALRLSPKRLVALGGR